MKPIFRLLLVIAVVATVAGCTKKREGKPRILVFTKTAAFRHASIPAGIAAFQNKIASDLNIIVDTTEDASKFNEDTLSQYAAVVFLNTTGDVLDNYQEADFERYIQAGGGFVGVHAGTDTEYDWPWYNHLVGAQFANHPEGIHDAKLLVKDQQFFDPYKLLATFNQIDEWYNFKKMDSTLKVLIQLDETSYKGGTMNNNHPIAWYHDYDGGRAFYTGMGHTPEAYSQENFLNQLKAGLKYAIGDNKVLDYGAATTIRVPSEDRFTKNVLAAGQFFEPTEMTILPNLDILVAQRRGELLLYKQADRSISQVGFLHVYHKTEVPHVNAEEGFLGLAADPDYKNNHYIYAFYSPRDTSVNRLSRFTFKDNKLDSASEKIILQFYSQRDICCHTGGSIAFGPDNLLYLSTGDNTTPFDEPNQKYGSKGYGPTDDRPGHLQYDGRRSSSNTNDLRGKILRIKVLADGTYTIPEGNLFPQGTAGTRPEIFAMGTRNPYRISVDRKNGYVYWGEVGPDANNDDSLRGPRGYDEVNQAKKPGYYGYPLFIADNKPYREYNYETGESGKFYDPKKPINNSRNNTGLKELPPAEPAFIWYPYAKSAEFPLVGAGGRNAEAGPVYYSEFYPKETRFPDYYNNKLFIYDWVRGWIMAVTMDKDYNYSKMERFMPHLKLNAPIDMEMGPDGRLYVLEYGNGWFSKNADAALTRIDYNGGNRAPVADIQVDKLSGGLPFTVKLTANGSKDPDGDKLTYLWTFGNGNKKETTEPTVTYTFTTAGEYNVGVEVKDNNGASTRSQQIPVYAGNEAPVVSINITGNKMFYFPGKQVQYAVNVVDKEDGSSANGKIDNSNLYVKADYVQGRDKAAMPQGHQIITGAIAGKNIMEVSDCKTCHKVDEKSIGPSFKQVADKYKADPNAPEKLAQKIINGGGGVWGETAMAAHPGLSTSEAKQLVEYIYSVGGATSKEPSLAASGSINPASKGPLKDDGVLYIHASYTDKGAAGIKPMTGTASVALYNPRIPASAYTKADGVSSFEINGMKFLIPGIPSSAVEYGDLDLTDVTSVDMNYMINAATDAGFDVTAFLDGNQIGTFQVGPGAQPMQPAAGSVKLQGVSDGKKHTLKFVFKPIDPAKQAQLGITTILLK
ncbi:Glucose/arabinose dehydrogenase, beta-propeller fold [Chitinophaga jiangningensis]|uniref:Glucose/arabinose dehydrogenase, beta-propeller fold n=1 Tax=Chitinophaga jiangningensis TaxID=1419482 RepID=A0A1M6WY82_9BACT|nr:ThuA domain-containing protein [Chitinophaga jiangningensis]SHK98742.1 Glucose/arabinose dehydrogenase, beta-propeller fold [Chitinophaga jiangningensis]